MSATLTPIPTNQPNNARPRLYALDDLADQLGAEAELRHQAFRNGRPLGAITGLFGLDTALGGFLAPGVHILHGAPGTGKTAFALQIATRCACPVVYVTCEMTPLELFRRLIAALENIPLHSLKNGREDGATIKARAVRTAKRLRHLAILDATGGATGTVGGGTAAVDASSVGGSANGTFSEENQPVLPDDLTAALNWLTAKATAAQAQTATARTEGSTAAPPVDPLPGININRLLIVDSLHSWAESLQVSGQSEYDLLNAALGELRRIARLHDCPLFAIAERNRQSMKAGGQSAGAGTRKIEYGAETVLELQDEAAENGGSASAAFGQQNMDSASYSRPIVLRLSKNRHGASGASINLRFFPAFQRFEEDG